MEIEHGTFTPLIIGTNGGMGAECKMFMKTLADKIATKQNEQYSDVITWIRTRLSFEVLRSSLLCIRGSRRPWSQPEKIGEDFKLHTIEAELFNRS